MDNQSKTSVNNPFPQAPTGYNLACLKGERNGNIQLATTKEVLHYKDLPSDVLIAAQDWAIELETLGAKKVYWLTLAEMLPHLHIHLYPRWETDTLKGVALFEQRETEPQPIWETNTTEALARWAKKHSVFIL